MRTKRSDSRIIRRRRFAVAIVASGLVLGGGLPASAQLDLASSRLVHQGTPGVIGTLEADDRFGSPLARGDFNGDGIMDLAVGSVGEDLGGLNADAGAVLVFYGGKAGALGGVLSTEVWVGTNIGWPMLLPVLGFGETMAAGDFDGDGFDELAIGMPQASAGGFKDAGVVWILKGAETGLQAAAAIQRLWAEFVDFEGDTVAMSPAAGLRFGAGLAVGDLNGDGTDDLAVGVPGFSFFLSVEQEEGAVQLFLGSAQGLEVPLSDANANGRYTTASWGAGLTDFDHLGEVLATGDFDGDGVDDLAMGLPNREWNGMDGAGVVRFAFGSVSGLEGTLSDRFAIVTDQEQRRLGTSLAVADFNQDGFDDVAMGAPGESFGGSSMDSGAVYLTYGTAQGLDPLLPNMRRFLYEPDLLDLGRALTVGDFDQNGWPDLAATTTVEEDPTAAGAVAVYLGEPTSTRPGLQIRATQIVQQGESGVVGLAQSGDDFGRVLVAGDFDHDGIDDLVVGANDRISGRVGAGSATLVPGRDGLCVADAESMCLRDGRFRVRVNFETAAGDTGSGQVVPQGSDDSGLFWFFNGNNWEMLVKVLNGCPINDRFWVLSAATTDVGFDLEVEDLLAESNKSFSNPVGQAASATIDIDALNTCLPIDLEGASALVEAGEALGDLALGDQVLRGEALREKNAFLARYAAARVGTTVTQREPTAETAAGVGTCVPSPGTLCLLENRFAVTVRWTVDEDDGRGAVVPVVSPDAGLFWFFDEDNWEMLVKMVDGCSVTGSFWVFAAATTDVGYVMSVLDTMSGQEVTYTNQQGVLAPAITDTSAFETCS